MRKDSEAAEYLSKTRGLLAASARSFRLGVVDAPLPGHEVYKGMLAIPYLTQAGPVTIRFRRIDLDPENPGDGPKYRSLPADPPRPYNVNALLHPSPVIAICEGEMDTITAEQSGIKAVGFPGVSTWRPKYARLFRGYDAVFVLADGDENGQGLQFAERIAEDVDGVRIIPMPTGCDVNKFVILNGPEALRKLLELPG